MLVPICIVLAIASVGYASVGDICPFTGKVVQEVIGNWEGTGQDAGWSCINGSDYAIGTRGATLGSQTLDLYTGNWTFWELQYDFQTIESFAGVTLCMNVSTYVDEIVGNWTDIGKIKIWSDGATGYLEVTPTVGIISGTDGGTDWGDWNGDSQRAFMWDLSSFDTTGATYISIAFSFNAGEVGPFHVDNVELCCPEPATMALLGLGGLALIRRKK